MSSPVAESDHLSGPVAAWDLYDMIQAFLQAPSYHVIFEVALIVWIVRLILTKSYKPQNTDLSEKEKNDLIEDWQPEPLVPDTPEDDSALYNMKNRIVDSKLGKYIKLNGKECLNVASLNFLGMVGRHDIEEVAAESINKYGVGSCGPRGFYGTVDVHLTLEQKLAKFMKQEEGIVYSYGFSTIASAIPAYSKRGDVLFADVGVHFAMQKGIQASRSKISYFKHNDMEDLERLLMEQADEDRKNPKKAKVTRRFVLVEGLYMKTGDICPLPKLVELKWKYKVRIFLDETFSFGTLGKNGRGITEHFGISPDEICLLTGSLEYALGSTGGFCVGPSYVIDHQRLSGLGYCFSASTPPMLTKAATKALEIMENNPKMLSTLSKNTKYLHSQLNMLDGLKLVGEPLSPVLFLQVRHSSGDRKLDFAALNKIVEYAEEHCVALTMASWLEEELVLPPPSIRIAVTCELTKAEMDRVVKIIKDTVEYALEGLENINDVSS